MRDSWRRWAVAVVLAGGAANCAAQAGVAAPAKAKVAVAPPPKTWVDEVTGHRVTRLTDEPGSATMYFNDNAFTGDGKYLIYRTGRGVYALDMQTRTSRMVYPGYAADLTVAPKTNRVFFTRQVGDHRFLNEVDVLSGEDKEYNHPMPPKAYIASVNADETLVAGTFEDPGALSYGDFVKQYPGQGKEEWMHLRMASKQASGVFTYEWKKNAFRTVLHGVDWYSHVVFSPVDPTLIMFCHEGPAKEVTRVWTVRTDGTAETSVRPRAEGSQEVVSNEFWGHDGKTIWYTLTNWKGSDYYIGGYDLPSRKTRVLQMQAEDASAHFNVAFDGSVFVGEGTGGTTPDRKWVELLRPQRARAVEEGGVEVADMQIEHLVRMDKDRYALTPHARFSPDGKMVVFMSDMLGPRYVFGVDVAREK